MASVEDTIQAAYDEVRSDSSETTWLVAGYKDKKLIGVDATGSGSIEEISEHLPDDDVKFVYFKMTTSDNPEENDGSEVVATRTKFIFFTWKGEKAGVMKKGNMSVHKESVQAVISSFAFETAFETGDEISEEELKKRLDAVNR
jgi:hypothetical protein